MTNTSVAQWRDLPRIALGRRSDWNLRFPRLRRLVPGRNWFGPLLIAATTLVGWFAFGGAQGEEGGSVQFGLFIGAASIVLMAWSFVLALRPRLLEPIFGGLDRMYRAHRWAGSLAIVAMFLHTQAEPEIEGGVRGAAESLADQAEGLAGVGEIMLYALVGISLIRWFPYRFWRWTHKLLGIPFAFACWHFFTAEKTYANGSPWGVWFGGIMLAGLGAFVLRVIGRDMLLPGIRHRITAVDRTAGTTELRMRPVNRPLDYEAGQFAVVKLRTPGMREPHAFTIASSPNDDELVFHIKDLGDWTHRLQTTDLLDTEAIIEGPYGRFRPTHGDQPCVWVAGGVGITPFLAALSDLEPAPPGDRPLLVYCVRDRETATALDGLQAAVAQGRLRLELFVSSEGRRFDPDELTALAGRPDLRGVHVAACGPLRLVGDVVDAARRAGSTSIETEDFDMRGGVGPDLSRPLDQLVSQARS